MPQYYDLLERAGYSVIDEPPSPQSLPKDLSPYALVWFTGFADQCTPADGEALGVYVWSGGSVAVHSEWVVSCLGNPKWIGATLSPYQVGIKRISTVVDNPFGTNLPSGTKLFDSPVTINHAYLFDPGPNATVIARNPEDTTMQAFVLTNTYGKGRVLYHETYPSSAGTDYTDDSDTLLVGGLAWLGGK